MREASFLVKCVLGTHGEALGPSRGAGLQSLAGFDACWKMLGCGEVCAACIVPVLGLNGDRPQLSMERRYVMENPPGSLLGCVLVGWGGCSGSDPSRGVSVTAFIWPSSSASGPAADEHASFCVPARVRR